MHSSEKDFSSIYNLQDKFLSWFSTYDTPFYLTGGTALGRFFLHHRFSEDIDLFVNDHPLFRSMVERILKSLPSEWQPDPMQVLVTDDFARFFITTHDDISLKVEFVNDVPYRPDQPLPYAYGWIDTPLNILANKLSAIIGRDEPKDVFDIIHLALNYTFDWSEPFFAAKKKSLLNELEVAERLATFPFQWFDEVTWLKRPDKEPGYTEILQQITDDFLFNRPNSISHHKPHIRQAKVNFKD